MITYNIEYILRQYGETHTVYLVTTINGVRKFKSTRWKVKPSQWDSKAERARDNHLKAEEINQDLAARKQALISSLLAAQLQGKSKIDLNTVHHNLYSFVEGWIEEVRNKRSEGTIKANEKHLKKLKDFAGPDLTFDEIDTAFLSRYENHIRGKGTKHRKGNSTYITAIWKTLKKWFNAARKKGLTDNYPFDQYENPVYDPDEKDFLNLSELNKWEKFTEGAKGETKQAALYFLLGCYSGLRISDWFKFSLKNVHNKEIRLRATKNNSWLTVPIHSRLKKVLDQIKVTPLTVSEPFINREIKEIAKSLKIDKYLTTHSARGTFAKTICLERGVTSETTAEIMGITLAVFIKSYSKITPEKIKIETSRAWAGL